MRLLLKSFSQDVDFLDPDKETSYLVFLEEATQVTIRLPVPKETILELVKLIHEAEPGTSQEDSDPEPPPETQLEAPDPDEGADVFGEEEEDLSEVPESEDDVPSM